MKFFVLLVLGFACASNPGILTDKAKGLEVYASAPAKCNVVGKITGIDQNGSPELAINHALNQAAKLGATGIVVNQEIPNGNKRAAHVTAYQCN